MIFLDAAAVVDVLIGAASAGWVLDQVAGQQISAPAHQPAEAHLQRVRGLRERIRVADGL